MIEPSASGSGPMARMTDARIGHLGAMMCETADRVMALIAGIPPSS
jgi:hypothetical protein